MSPLREDIQSARREYRAIRYPGDLPAELLPIKFRWKILLALGSLSIGSIAAAAVVGALMIRPLLAPAPPHSTGTSPLFDRLPLARDLESELAPLPDELRSLVPQSPSDFRVPSWDDLHFPTLSQSPEHA